MKINIYSNSKQHLSDELREYIRVNFDGLYIKNFDGNKNLGLCYSQEKCKLCITDNPIETIDGNPRYEKLYTDEPISAKYKGDELNKWDRYKYPEIIEYIKSLNKELTIGELSSKAFNMLKEYNVNVTFTAYKRYIKWIEKLFNIRIYIPCTNPLVHWEDLELQFEERFNMVWVHCFKNVEDAKELKEWARRYNKEVWIYAGVNTWKNEEELIKYLDKWLKA